MSNSESLLRTSTITISSSDLAHACSPRYSNIASISADCYSPCVISSSTGISADCYSPCVISSSTFTASSNNKNKKDEVNKMKEKFTPKRILFNDPATIVFWKDGTKTVVKRSPGEEFNAYTAFCAALAKKIFGNNSAVNRIVKSGTDQHKKDMCKQMNDTYKTEKKAKEMKNKNAKGKKK